MFSNYNEAVEYYIDLLNKGLIEDLQLHDDIFLIATDKEIALFKTTGELKGVIKK